MKLHEYPEQIEGAALQLHEASEQLQSVREQLGRIEIQTKADVIAAKDESTGKALFSNTSTPAGGMTHGCAERNQPKRFGLIHRQKLIRTLPRMSWPNPTARTLGPGRPWRWISRLVWAGSPLAIKTMTAVTE